MEFFTNKSKTFSWKSWLQSNHTAVWYIIQIWLSQSEFHVGSMVNSIFLKLEILKVHIHLKTLMKIITWLQCLESGQIYIESTQLLFKVNTGKKEIYCKLI